MEKHKRTFVIPDNIDKALGYASVEHSKERSTLIIEALKLYLPTITKNPLILEAVKEAPLAALL